MQLANTRLSSIGQWRAEQARRAYKRVRKQMLPATQHRTQQSQKLFKLLCDRNTPLKLCLRSPRAVENGNAKLGATQVSQPKNNFALRLSSTRTELLQDSPVHHGGEFFSDLRVWRSTKIYGKQSLKHNLRSLMLNGSTGIFIKQIAEHSSEPEDITNRHRYRRSIRTLDPEQLTAEDFLEISEMNKHCKLNFLQSSTRRQAFCMSYAPNKSFPLNTRGFLHYHTPPSMPPTAGEIRFRVTHGSGPADFHTGCDLLLPNGLPWSLPLIMLAHGLHRQSSGSSFQRELLVKSLVRDRLVDTAMLDELAMILEAGGWRATKKQPSNIIHNLDQLFHVQLDRGSFVCIFVGENKASPTKVQSPFAHSRGSQFTRAMVYPFRGQ